MQGSQGSVHPRQAGPGRFSFDRPFRRGTLRTRSSGKFQHPDKDKERRFGSEVAPTGTVGVGRSGRSAPESPVRTGRVQFDPGRIPNPSK